MRISHWVLAAILSLNLTWGHDWLQFPGLWSHYLEHEQAASGGLGLFDFLVLHYADEEHHATDGSHENLPFQHHHHGYAFDQCMSKVPGHGPLRPVSFPTLSGQMALRLPLDDDLLAGHYAELLRPPQHMA